MATGVAKTHYLEKKLLDHVLRNVAYSQPATVYLALYTATPNDQGGGTELIGNAYARQAITFGAATDNGASVGGQSATTVDILFPVATANWGTITHVGIFDAVSAGNLLYYGALTASKTINSGDQFKVSAGQLTVLED